LPLPGAAGIAVEPIARRLAASSTLPAATNDRLVNINGARATEILALATTDPELARTFDSETGAIGAELVFAARTELAETLEDLLLRRTMVGLASHAGIGPDTAAAAVAEHHLGWSAEHAALQVRDYRHHAERFRPKSLAGSAAN
jgi:glycerol-3-phosphate dehydrogenase